MKEIISENINNAKPNQNKKKQVLHKNNIQKAVDTAVADNSVIDNTPSVTIVADIMKPENWEMITDTLVELHDDILFMDEKLVVKNTGLKAGHNESIGESSMESVLVKSSVKFATIVHPGKNTNYEKGDIVSINGSGIKQIDFDKKYAVVPHFMIYGKIGKSKGVAEQATARKNIFGWFMQGRNKRMGLDNVHKQ